MERVLAIGYGNPGRLDDGLGPALAEILSEQDLPGVTVEANYQLTVEDAAAISEHDAVVFVDASVGGPEPFSFQHVTPDAEATVSFSTHSIEPAALLALSRDLFGADTPGYVLGVRGYAFDEFGERLSRGAAANLAAALQFLVPVLRARSMAVAAGAAAQRAAPPHPTGTRKTDPMDSGKYVILIVDDDPDLRDAMTRILEREGYGVLTADSAEDGLRQFKSGQPDLVIVDLMMEEVDAGTNLVRELKLLGSEVPVYMLSSVGDALHGTVSVADLGLSGVFQKPLDRKVLLSAIEARLG